MAFEYVANAAYICSCGRIFLAAQPMLPNKPFRTPKLDTSNLHFPCVRAQQAGHEQSGPPRWGRVPFSNLFRLVAM